MQFFSHKQENIKKIYPLLHHPEHNPKTGKGRAQKRDKSLTLTSRTYRLKVLFSAEREGFEPPDPLRSTVFKTAAFDHSAISPVVFPFERECKGTN